MYLSLRKRFGAWDDGWPGYRYFIGLPELQEVRTVDPNLNEELEPFESKTLWYGEELDSAISVLSAVGEDVYYQLAVEHSEEGQLAVDSRLKLLGYDLTESGNISGTSSLLNCGIWEGEPLLNISKRRKNYGLLTLDDAVLAQSALPAEWGEDEPHANVDIVGVWQVIVDNESDDI